VPAPEVVRPAHLWVPERRGSYLDEVADVAERIGRPLDAEQRIAVDAKCSYGPRGDWLTLETGLLEPRQNGKTAGIETPIVLTDLFLWPADRIAWTAHLFKTTREAFDDHKRLIEGYSDFSRRVLKISEAHGEESIQLRSGARIDYLARSKGGGRGLGGKRVVLDEALFFAAAAAGALLPIMAARGNPQVDYLSSASKIESDLLRALAERGRAGGDPSLIWVEWCAPGSFDRPGCEVERCTHERGNIGCVLDDEDYWRAANPAVRSGRIRISFLRAMRRTLPPTEFAREFLGWHEAGLTLARPIKLADWLALADPLAKPLRSPVGIALDTSKGLASAAIAAVGRLLDGRRHVELLKYAPGVDWTVAEAGRLAERLETKVRLLGGSSTAKVLAPALDDKRVPYEETTSADYAAACTLLVKDITDAQLVHLGDPVLQRSIEAARAVPVGDTGSWRWSPERSEGDTAPIVAATLARWQLEVSPQPDYDLALSVG
jgi:hypothetical protein